MSPSDELMTCAAVAERIEAFTDGDLDEATIRGVRRHLDVCPACAEQAEFARTLTAELRALPKLDMPDRIMAGVRESAGIPSESKVVVLQRRRRPWLAAAAAFILVITGALLIYQQQRRQTDRDALRAAAEIEYALACVGDITRRANQTATVRVMNQAAISSAVGNLNRTLDLSTNLLTTLDPSAGFDATKGSS